MPFLTEALANAFFGSGEFRASLVRDGTPVATQVITMKREGTNGTVRVVFEFDKMTSFDTVVMTRDGDIVGTDPVGSVSLPPGAIWQHDLQIVLGETE